jgi:hypothetical protein
MSSRLGVAVSFVFLSWLPSFLAGGGVRFWVAQRFSAAMELPFTARASAPEERDQTLISEILKQPRTITILLSQANRFSGHPG